MLLLVLATSATTLSASAQSANWVQCISPTDKNNATYGVRLSGDYIAAVRPIVGRQTLSSIATLRPINETAGEVIKTWIDKHGQFYYYINSKLSAGGKLCAIEMEQQSPQLSLTKSLMLKRVADNPEDYENCLGWHGDVYFDNESNAYVMGQYDVAKFNKFGV